MFNQRPEDRIRGFRLWRKSIEDKPLHETVQEVTNFWCSAPISNQYYSPDLDREWPDPWQLVHEGHYDDISRGLAMFYSLALLENKCYNSVRLAVCKCPDNIKLCAIINNEYFLNYDWGSVVSKEQIEKDVELIKVYEASDFEFLK